MPPQKKLFFLITKGTPFGGAQNYILNLASSLPAEQFDRRVVLGQPGELGRKLKQQNIPTIEILGLIRDVGLRRDWSAFWEIIRLFKSERPDIVHLNSSKAGILGAIAARLAGVKTIIFTGHAWAFNEDRPFWQKIAIKTLQWLTVWLSHKTIAVSEKTKSQIANWPGMKQKICVIHNGIDPIDFLSRFEARERLAKIAWKKGFDQEALQKALIIGTIAELHKNKGLDFLIEALGALKDKLSQSLIFIIGEGEEKDTLKEQAKKLGLKEQIVFLGKVDNAKAYLHAFDIFVLPSRTEALPYVLLEAAQAELPIIASAVGGIPEIISEFNQGILVRPGNIKEIRLALVRLLENPAERQKFGNTLAKKVNRDFTVEKMVEKTLQAYKQASK